MGQRPVYLVGAMGGVRVYTGTSRENCFFVAANGEKSSREPVKKR